MSTVHLQFKLSLLCILQVPVFRPMDLMVEASPRRIFANAHTYHINSISINSDYETYLSADDLRINLWHLEITDRSFSIFFALFCIVYVFKKKVLYFMKSVHVAWLWLWSVVLLPDFKHRLPVVFLLACFNSVWLLQTYFDELLNTFKLKNMLWKLEEIP